MRLLSLFLILGLCSRPFALGRNEQSERTMEAKASVARRTEAASDTTAYIIIPKDGTDQDLLDRLKTTIMSTTQTSDVAGWTTGGQLKWYYADLTASEVTKLERNDDIKYITENKPLIPLRAIPTKLSDNLTNFADSTSKPTLSKREQQWSHQPNDVIRSFPPNELKVISTPKGKDWRFQPEYVYAAEAGEDIHIFHIEDGILPGYEEEFDNRVQSPLLTDTYNWLPEMYIQPPDGHSTCVADKAMGKFFGAAKKARLVPVLLGEGSVGTVAEAFSVVRETINKDRQTANPVYYKKSIVMMSMGINVYNVPNLRTTEPWISIEIYISALFDLGVPVILSAGNMNVQDPIRSHRGSLLDVFPQVLESDDFPLINVGSIHRDGSIATHSMRGPQVVVFAPGTEVICAGFGNRKVGTSYAAPLVAGSLAVFMSQKEGPFYDKTHTKAGTRDFVFAVQDFVKKDASYLNSKGVQQFWNLAPSLF